MKRLFLLVSLLSVLSSPSFAQDSSQSYESGNRSVFNKNQKFDAEGVELYDSNYDLKTHKRLGAGLMVGGAAGLLGLNVEINVEPDDAAVFGIGTGEGYNSFNIGWKHNFIGNYLSPYTKVGYSKWFNTAGGANSAKNSDVLKRVLTDDEIRNNRFGADFIVGSAGLEYNQLEGELSGVNFYGELVMLGEIKKTTFVPSGAVGVTYYY